MGIEVADRGDKVRAMEEVGLVMVIGSTHPSGNLGPIKGRKRLWGGGGGRTLLAELGSARVFKGLPNRSMRGVFEHCLAAKGGALAAASHTSAGLGWACPGTLTKPKGESFHSWDGLRRWVGEDALVVVVGEWVGEGRGER